MKNAKYESNEKVLSGYNTDDLIAHVQKNHHDYLKKELPITLSLMLDVILVHCKNHPELFKIHSTFGTLKTGLEGHLIQEEVNLFPNMKEGKDGIKALIEKLEKEHDGAEIALAKLTELTNNFTPPEDACSNYSLLFEKLEDFVDNMHNHIQTENNILFKRAL
ncbi:MAG: hemerythrin domain-containing protein [Peptostreptococcales bacterium]|jgi:regulator of cell morphogenesis and NO signaling